MFLGDIKNLGRDRKVLPEALVKGLEYLNNTDFSHTASGEYPIDGDTIFAIVQEHQTSPKAERKAEAHAQKVDIQYVIAGAELIGFALPHPANEVLEDRLESTDNIFFKKVHDESELLLTPGKYAIFFPGEVHRPCCCYGDNRHLRKVVVKIAADLL